MDGYMNVKQFSFRFWEHISNLLKIYFYCWCTLLFFGQVNMKEKKLKQKHQHLFK